MAYASLLSLGQTLEQILHPQNESLLFLHQTERQLLKSLHENVGSLLAFLDAVSPKSNEKVVGFEERIRKAAYGAEDLVESQIYLEQIWSESHESRLQTVKEELDTISNDLVQMKENDKIEILQPAASSKPGSTYKSVILGLDDEINYVQNLLFKGPAELEIISIVGMPGLRKTTLARQIYNNSHTVAHFDLGAWATVSKEFSKQQILEDILNSSGDLNHESQQRSVDKLAEKLYKRLKGKRFLIVMDDVLDASAVEKIKMLLPKDNNGSRILLTSRSLTVAKHLNLDVEPYILTFLSDEECWDLLQERAFREHCCPPKLQKLGKMIARECGGLPLVTVLTGGLLYKAEKTVDYWEYVVKNLRIDDGQKPRHIVNFYYDQLPHHLRACLVYMGVLPEDYAIRRSKLIKLWVVNRFIKPDKSKSLEEVAKEYLQDLVDRNLIMVREWTRSGDIKTCSIHDVIRDLCLMKANEMKINFEAGYLPQVHNNLRHVSIVTDTTPTLELTQNSDMHVRSVMFFFHNTPSDIHFVTIFRLLRILDALTLSLDEFPLEFEQLITLRYIALTLWLKHEIPASIFELCNLETLIINPGKLKSIFNASFFPPEIWKLSRLRHLLFVRGFLPYPTEALNAGNNYILFENLQTLGNVVNFRWTKEVLQMMPDLKKLVVSYEHDERTKWSSYCFDNFVLLHQLEVLKCYFFGKSYMKYHNPLPVKFAFPHKLKRLTLSGCRISWKDMTIIGSLPNLRVLKLKFHAFEGSIWEPNNGEFCQLKLLLIHMMDLEDWKADETHFPSLECLTLNYCYNLVEIPSGIGKIPTLREINLCGCSTSVMTSAEIIQQEQKKSGNGKFQVVLKQDDDEANIFS